MKPGVLAGVGVVAVVVGVLWSLQGFDVLGGSSMSGSSFWAVVGPVVAVAGLVMIFLGWRRGSLP
jgi:hypothetical protein